MWDEFRIVEGTDNDRAWEITSEILMHYLEHAQKSEFTATQTLMLTALVYAHQCTILEQEGKTVDALGMFFYNGILNGDFNEGSRLNVSGFVKRNKLKPVKNEIFEYAQNNFSHKNILSADLRQCQLDAKAIFIRQ
ncbi:MAG: hypothetical protein JKY55_06360 [Aliivibrio sp.]|uniref:hypothetical protein n=1 Tax=Aliivibrio sp. TaxID=1872443 RepID=UPI001A4D1391|nr:hypothetical protein [Aliivibrio sp.]